MTTLRAQKTRLRKQPKMRRVQSATAVPLTKSVPRTAQKRRRRNSQERIRRPVGNVMGLLLTSRWISLGVLAAAIYALVFIGGQDRFFLHYIPVEGAATIPPTEIVKHSGLAGSHIFAADPERAAEQLAALPGIISSTVTLRWPNEVLVQVREDPPTAIWQESGQTYWIIGDGRLIPARTQTVGLLEIVAETRPTAGQPGDGATSVSVGATPADAAAETEPDEAATEATSEAELVEGAEGTTTTAGTVPPEVLVGAMQLRALRPNIDKLYYRPGAGLSYQDGRGWRVYFGVGEGMRQRLVVYEKIVEELLARGVRPEYISVTNQRKPFFKAAP